MTLNIHLKMGSHLSNLVPGTKSIVAAVAVLAAQMTGLTTIIQSAVPVLPPPIIIGLIALASVGGYDMLVEHKLELNKHLFIPPAVVAGMMYLPLPNFGFGAYMPALYVLLAYSGTNFILGVM